METNQSKKLLEAVRVHPLFAGVDESTAFSLIKECQERSYHKGQTMLKSDTPRQGLFLVLEGIAEVYVKNDHSGQPEVLEVIQKGELIGFSSLAGFLAGAGKISRPAERSASQSVHQNQTQPDDREQLQANNHLPEKGRLQAKGQVTVEVRAAEPVKVLFIPFETIAKRWDDPKVHDYLLSEIAIRIKDVYGSLAEQVKLARGLGEKEAFMTRVQDIMSTGVINVAPRAAVQDAAKAMSKGRTSSVLVIDNDVLAGIITERDMVERVVANGLPMDTAVQSIMTPNPVTIARFAYFYEAISAMLLNGVKHLPVTDETGIVGVVTLSDLLRKKNESVLKTIRRIDQADERNLSQVKVAIYDITNTLLKESVPVFSLLNIVTNLYDRLVERLVELSIEKLKTQGDHQPSRYAFYQMGSGGRGEQFMLTDQDHFLVYEEVSGAEAYFTKLGKEITEQFAAAGYARCQGLMMASEKAWQGSVEQWEGRLRQWMVQSTNDNLLLAQNFFSYRFAAGSQELNEQFEQNLARMLERSRIFLFRLAQLERNHPVPALDQPVRALFKLQRKTIDMKKEILFPYHHSLQILSLANGVLSGTPLEKMDQLCKKGVLTNGLASDLKEAVAHIMAIYMKLRWPGAKQDGKIPSVLNCTSLTTREKDELILSLRTIKELQSLALAEFVQ